MSSEKGNWVSIEPDVNSSAEFFEIVNDFGSPLEIVREAISNSVDWGASFIRISFEAPRIAGVKRLLIKITDDGKGMTEDVLSNSFWGLGFSEARKLKEQGNSQLIGEKGHGTKIYLRSEKVTVRTKSSDGCFESVCEQPFKALSSGKLHSPSIRRVDNCLENTSSGTEIEIIGYNDNERSSFIQDIVKDYILWFSKIGSIEMQFGVDVHQDFKVHLKCIDRDEFEPIGFGHVFPDESSDIDTLIDTHEYEAADHYVKRYTYPGKRLTNHPEVTFDALISIEGDKVKRDYNKMIQERTRKESGKYKVSDRYGVWLCKDYIPVANISDWISGFGTGSNSLTLVHGFVNCQDLMLTANRGAVSNTDPQIQQELQLEIQNIFDEIDADLHTDGIYTLRSWQKERKTLKQENAEFARRVKSIKRRKSVLLDGVHYLEPTNETELFGLFISLYTKFPDKFLFEPLDYNSSKGIDLIGRNKTDNKISEGEYWYIEFKYLLKKEFNHAFKHLRWILCWDFDKNISDSTELHGVEETDPRYLKTETDENGNPMYFLDKRTKGGNRIEIIKLKEYLTNELNITFK